MHTATHWQVTLDTDPTFATPVFSEISFTDLLTILVPDLLPSTNYLIRARYMDDEGVWSDWGTSTAFTTLAENTEPQPGVWADCEHDQAA